MFTKIIIKHSSPDALKASPLWREIMAVAFVSDEAVSVEEIALDDEYTAACLANSHDRHDDQDNG